MGFLEKIRSKPKKTRLIILWSIIIPVGIIFAFFWIKITASAIRELSAVTFPQTEEEFFSSEILEESMENMKMFFNEEEIKKILEEEELKTMFEKEEENQKEEIKEENEN